MNAVAWFLAAVGLAVAVLRPLLDGGADTATIAVSAPNPSLPTPVLTTTTDHTTAFISSSVRGFATLVGGDQPTGTVTFELFSDSACTVRVFTSTNPVTPSPTGAAGAESAPYVITAGGVYHWVSTYSGDARNNPAGPTPCGDPPATVTIPKSSTEITTQAVPATATVGAELRSIATLHFGTLPTGTVTFHLYDDDACASQVFMSTVPLDPVSRTATSDPYVADAPGVYHWVGAYSGDVANLPSPRSACQTFSSTVRVTGAPPTTTTVPATTTTSSTTTTVPATTTTSSTTTTVPATTTTSSTTTTVPATTTTSSTTTTVPATTTTSSTTTTVPATTTTSSTTTTVPATTTTSSTTTTVPATTTTSSTTTTVPTTPPVPTASVFPASVAPGQTVTVAGTGFPAGAPLRVDLRSVPVPLATTVADASGSYQVVVRVPDGTTPGRHTIVVSGPNGEPRAEAAVTVEGTPLSLLGVLLSLLGLLG